ncbi:MAG TPA: hypothetical protein V6D43_20565 [Candidatus Sericytochromatia bacterium]
MFQHLSSDSSQSPDIATLLDKLASQPNGLENGLKLAALLMHQPEPQPTPETVSRTRLIAIALRLVRNEGIKNPPYFKGISDTAIREFIAQYSPELVFN